jgi:hypothetical protein
MPQLADHAAHRRDQRLARTRRVSLWVAGGAAAASLGLGTAFAHDLPGHHAPAASAQPGAPAGPVSQNTRPKGTQASPGPAGSAAPAPQSPPAQRPAAGAATDPSPAPTHLSQPQQPPATMPAPAQTVSGGS